MKGLMKTTAIFVSILFLVTSRQCKAQGFGELYTESATAISNHLKNATFNTLGDKEVIQLVGNAMVSDPDRTQRNSLAFIKRVLPEFNKRPLVKSWLHTKAGFLYGGQGDGKASINDFIAATNQLDKLYAEITVQRQEVLVEMGNQYLGLRDKENADKAFLAAYSFPYWTFPRISLDSKRRIEIAYRRAIRGLILSRAGNVQKLKEIRIIPAANDLRPTLEEAIKQAEGKMDEE